jgi:hypothetical protein
MYSNKTLIGNWSADRSYKAEELANSKAFSEIPVDDSVVDKLEKVGIKKSCIFTKRRSQSRQLRRQFLQLLRLVLQTFPQSLRR